MRIVARTGTRFADFGPMVAAASSDGGALFAARLTDGSSGVFHTDRGGCEVVASSTTGDFDEVVSHPAGEAEIICFTARSGNERCLHLVRGGVCSVLARGLGVLGPTMAGRRIAYRLGEGAAEAIGVADADGHGESVVLRLGRKQMESFGGLPLQLDSGATVVRVGLGGTRSAIVSVLGGEATTLAESGDELLELGDFPAASGGVVGFAGRSRRGALAFLVEGRVTREIAAEGDGFASVRAVWPGQGGEAWLAATPRGGTLGVYRRVEGAWRRLIGVGDPCPLGVVRAFAANHVSIGPGVLALRLVTDGGVQAIALAGATE